MAAQDLERLVVQLSADIRKYENTLNKMNGITNRRARAIETRFAKMNRTIASGYAALGASAAKAFALIGGANGAKNLIDSATRIENALKVAGLSGAELESVYQSLYASALKNAAPLETLVTLYGRLALVQKELGISGSELENFTDKVAVALRVSGASATEASGALLQLSQALGGGVVRAEEFNSIQEGALPILQAVAAGLKEAGGSVARLRQLVVDGKVTSEAFFRAFEAGSPILEQKVAGATFTLDQRLTNLGTALTNAAKEFNESTQAGETFGNEIDRVARFVATIDFDSLITEISEVANAFNMGAASARQFFEDVGRATGLEDVGKWLTGGAARKDFFGGGLTITSTAGITDRINQAFEGQIEQAGQMTSEAIRNSVLGRGDIASSGKGGRLPPSGGDVTPVSLDDFTAPAGSGSGGRKARGGGRSKASDYQREIEQIRQRTANLQAETAAQAALNPLVDDYGFAVEKARAKQELLNAAQEAGKSVTPELAREIDNLSTAYALAVQESEKLADKQDEIRERAENAMATAKDVTRGIIDGFTDGAKAGDILLDTLKKIGDSLINDVLDSISKVNSAGGSGGGGFLSGLLGIFGGGSKGAFPSAPVGLYSSGGYTGAGGKYEPAGIVHKGEYVMDAETTRRIGVDNLRRLQGYANGGLVGAPSLPKLPGSNTGAVTVDARTTFQASGNRETDQEMMLALRKRDAELPALILKTVRDAQGRRKL